MSERENPSMPEMGTDDEAYEMNVNASFMHSEAPMEQPQHDHPNLQHYAQAPIINMAPVQQPQPQYIAPQQQMVIESQCLPAHQNGT